MEGADWHAAADGHGDEDGEPAPAEYLLVKYEVSESETDSEDDDDEEEEGEDGEPGEVRETSLKFVLINIILHNIL